MDNVITALLKRRSIRKYLEQQVSDEHLDVILQSALYAPSGGNHQYTRFIVVRNHKLLTELNQIVKDEFSAMEVEEGKYQNKTIIKAKKDDYNFIVYDTTKDYIENFESLKNIFEINKGEKLIMFLSNHNEIREMVNTIDLYSSTEFILKPIGKDEFINNIKYAINKKAANEMETDLKEMQSNLIENQTIMLVEDNDVNRIALKTILEKRGYNVIVAENGAVALKLFTLNTINIILMDIQMPVMDGYEATKKIRELEKMSKSKVPILGVTAYTSDENKKKYFQSGMDDYIAKPIRVDDLYIVLDKYL